MSGAALAASAMGSEETKAGAEWKAAINETLVAEGYVRVGDKQMVGLLCAVYVLQDHESHIGRESVEIKVVGCGLAGMAGNKGGVSVRFTMYGTELTFVNTHFAAHEGAAAKRNQDYESVAKALLPELILHDGNKPTMPFTIRPPPGPLFWFGDLNYRIPLGFDAVHAAIDGGDLAILAAAEELTAERAGRRAFGGFAESALVFQPTYKFRVGTSEYDRRAGSRKGKRRTPAWCDRVLWAGLGVRPLLERADCKHPLGYTSHPAVTASDHKPVTHCLLVSTNSPATM